MMDKELKARWVAALCSGEYEQAEGALHRGSGYCCLGVLCEEAQFDDWDGHLLNGNPNGFEKDRWEKLTGTSALVQEHLQCMNDSDACSFAQIADYIEENL